jgi:hypothetical protein
MERRWPFALSAVVAALLIPFEAVGAQTAEAAAWLTRLLGVTPARDETDYSPPSSP